MATPLQHDELFTLPDTLQLAVYSTAHDGTSITLVLWWRIWKSLLAGTCLEKALIETRVRTALATGQLIFAIDATRALQFVEWRTLVATNAFLQDPSCARVVFSAVLYADMRVLLAICGHTTAGSHPLFDAAVQHCVPLVPRQLVVDSSTGEVIDDPTVVTRCLEAGREVK
jgi:hypothetical protein